MRCDSRSDVAQDSQGCDAAPWNSGPRRDPFGSPWRDNRTPGMAITPPPHVSGGAANKVGNSTRPSRLVLREFNNSNIIEACKSKTSSLLSALAQPLCGCASWGPGGGLARRVDVWRSGAVTGCACHGPVPPQRVGARQSGVTGAPRPKPDLPRGLRPRNALLSYLTEHCCQGQSCAPTARAVLAANPPGAHHEARFHVHVHVTDLAQNIAFYSKMFGTEPTRVKPTTPSG